MQRVGAWLRGVAADESLGRRLAEVRALGRWSDLVGPHLAKRTRPLRLAGERLFVVAHGSALRQELTFHKSTILRKFNEAAGRRAAREIVFLESDAKLSSLVEREGQDEIASVRPRAEAPEPDRDTGPGEPVYPDGPAYQRFDADGYRRELEREAHA